MKINIYLVFTIVVFLTGCVDTEGFLEMKGKVIDEFTKEQIPGRDIIVKGLIKMNGEFEPLNAGQFLTDSSGRFMYLLRKIKDVHYYNFSLVGDSDYAFKSYTIGLPELDQRAKFMVFPMSKLADLTIIINRKSKTPAFDTLALYWESNGVHGWVLYPFRIYNFNKSNNSYGLISGSELRWRGGNVNSKIYTKVFAGKRTKLLWDLDRNGKRMEFIDTITCKRNITNTVYFTY
jgi:hypothetical protein